VLIYLDATSMECDDTDSDAEEAKNIFRMSVPEWSGTVENKQKHR
jgi:hypothetical protein